MIALDYRETIKNIRTILSFATSFLVLIADSGFSMDPKLYEEECASRTPT